MVHHLGTELAHYVKTGHIIIMPLKLITEQNTQTIENNTRLVTFINTIYQLNKIIEHFYTGETLIVLGLLMKLSNKKCQCT